MLTKTLISLVRVLRAESRRVMRAAPLLPVAVGLILGVALDHFVAPGMFVHFGMLLGAPLALTAPRVRLGYGAFPLLVAAMGLGGWLHHRAERILPAHSIVHDLEPGVPRCLARLRGIVDAPPRLLDVPPGPFARWSFRGERTSFVLRVDSIATEQGPRPVTGRINVTVAEPVLDLREGERIEAFGWLRPLRRPANPGSIDWAAYHRRNGVAGSMNCDHRESLQRISDPGKQPRSGVVSRLRATVRGWLINDFPTDEGEHAGLIDAMVLGNRSTMTRRMDDAFIRSGCSHFLAVSGSNVGMLMAFVWVAGRMLGISKRRSALGMMAIVVLYAIVVEPRPPIFRAAVMGLLFCGALLLHRGHAHLNWLAAAAAILVITQPSTLFDAGFQLSFVAVLGVTLVAQALPSGVHALTGGVRRAFVPGTDSGRDEAAVAAIARLSGDAGSSRLRRWSGTMLAVGLGAWIAGAPLTCWYFQRVHTWGWLASIVMFPVMQMVMVLGLCKVAVASVSPALAEFITPLLIRIDELVIRLVFFFESLPGASVNLSKMPVGLLAVWYGVLLFLVLRFHPKRSLAGSSRVVCKRPATTALNMALAGSLGAAVLGTYWWLRPGAPGQLTVNILSVGAGSATVIELPDGQVMVYDAGSTGAYDVGAGVVVPFLRDRGIRRVDALHVSHADVDHFSGVPTVVSEMSVGEIIINEFFDGSAGSAAGHLLHLLEEEGALVTTSAAVPRRWEYGGATFEWLWPAGPLDSGLRDNELSTVLRISYAGRSVLLTGDIEDHAQRALLARGGLNADVLVLPHHGSVRPSTEDFLAAVGAGALVRSSHERMADTVNGIDVLAGMTPLYNTADTGAVMIELDAEGYRIRTMFDKSFD